MFKLVQAAFLAKQSKGCKLYMHVEIIDTGGRYRIKDKAAGDDRIGSVQVCMTQQSAQPPSRDSWRLVA